MNLDLFSAIRGGNVEEVRALPKNKESLNQFNASGMTPVMLASSLGHLKIIELLAKEGADLNLMPDRRSFPNQTEDFSALMYAIKSDHVDAVSLLLKLGARVDNSALAIACKHGNAEIVEMLLSNGADANEAKCSSHFPLYLAVKGRHVKVAEVLLKKGAKVIQNGSSALERACYSKEMQRVGTYDAGNIEMVKTLLEFCSNEDVNFLLRDGFLTPLMRASCGGANDIIEELVTHGADVNTVSKRCTHNSNQNFALSLAIMDICRQ